MSEKPPYQSPDMLADAPGKSPLRRSALRAWDYGNSGQNALAALAQLPETADQRRLRLLAHETAKLQHRLAQLELTNAWLIQVVQHFVVQSVGNGQPNPDQVREDWDKLVEAFQNISGDASQQASEQNPA